MSDNRRAKLPGAVMSSVMAIISAVGAGGCATAPRQPFQAERYRIELRMEPATHRLTGRTVLDLSAVKPGESPADGPVALELRLHPNLAITRVTAGGATVKRHLPGKLVPSDSDDGFAPRRHLIVLAGPVDALTLFVHYQGNLFQDVSAGEVPGEIHNFAMRAHIGEEGIYLGSDAYWYPRPAAAGDAAPILADFTVIAEPVAGFELVAGAEHDPHLSEQTGRLAWRSPYPLDGMVLVGGAHEVHRTTRGGVTIELHLKPDQAKHVDGLFESVQRILDRYEPLIGPYPGREYAVVDNFFSSGFAFPTFTLLSSAVINMGERAQKRHGMLDHEMLHCWWGNGIHVDPRDGDWCEALASYGANYYGHVLDGREDEARRKRRNYSHFLSRLEADEDQPLGTYGQEGGCGRGIAYHKGAAVLHMLARKIGQDNFWGAMQRFTDEYLGRYASWDDIRRLAEEESGITLETFFGQWVRGRGAPVLEIKHARYDPAEQKLALGLSQGEPAFELNVPIRINHPSGHLDIEVPLEVTDDEVIVPVNVIPLTVEVDPDYHVFRKVPPEQIVPTTAATRHGSAFTCILPQAEPAARYKSLQSIFEGSFEENERRSLTVSNVEEGALAECCVLVLGDAARDPYISAFLSAIEFPLHWTEEGFEFEGDEYTEDGDAVLCTVSHPGVPGGGVTVLYANSAAAIPVPTHIPFYDRSVVLFKDGRAVARHDLERRALIQVQRESG